MKKFHVARRNFIGLSSMTLLSHYMYPISSFYAKKSRDRKLTCQEVVDHFRSADTKNRVNWEQTTDTIKIGNPDKPVNHITVAWKASMDAIQKAIDMNADLFISHESICVNADNQSDKPEINFALPSEMPKFESIRKAGLVVYRCHDFWDSYPKVGMRDSWLTGLALNGNIIEDSYPYLVTEIPPTTLGNLARHILNRIRPLKQNGILVTGDLDTRVNRVGTGTGVTTDPVALKNLGANVGILTDDYYKHVRMGVHAEELDFPTIIVNHGVTEEWGTKNLYSYVKKNFPGLETTYIPQYCPFKVIT